MNSHPCSLVPKLPFYITVPQIIGSALLNRLQITWNYHPRSEKKKNLDYRTEYTFLLGQRGKFEQIVGLFDNHIDGINNYGYCTREPCYLLVVALYCVLPHYVNESMQ